MKSLLLTRLQQRKAVLERRRKANAEGDLKVTSTELASNLDVKGSLHQTCVTKAQEFDAEMKSREEELTHLRKQGRAFRKQRVCVPPSCKSAG